MFGSVIMIYVKCPKYAGFFFSKQPPPCLKFFEGTPVIF